MNRLKDRIPVVSGAAAGIGKAAAVRLAAEGVIVEILDIKDAAIASRHDRVDILVNNAGILSGNRYLFVRNQNK